MTPTAHQDDAIEATNTLPGTPVHDSHRPPCARHPRLRRPGMVRARFGRGDGAGRVRLLRGVQRTSPRTIIGPRARTPPLVRKLPSSSASVPFITRRLRSDARRASPLPKMRWRAAAARRPNGRASRTDISPGRHAQMGARARRFRVTGRSHDERGGKSSLKPPPRLRARRGRHACNAAADGDITVGRRGEGMAPDRGTPKQTQRAWLSGVRSVLPGGCIAPV